jgi:hypothetical protein
MKFETIKNLKPEEFRLLTGVKKATFEKMIEIIEEVVRVKKASSLINGYDNWL